MEDDIFAQLMNLVNNKPTNPGSDVGFGAVRFGDLNSSGGSDDSEMFQSDDVVVPDFKPRKEKREKKLIIVIDDDFSTLDLMKIYLQRDYECKMFDDPKNAIFFLNSCVPDLIFVDCYLNTMKTKKVADIIRTYKELNKVPIIYLAEPSGESAISGKLPEGVLDIISRPVKRGDLQNILDKYIADSDDDGEEERVDHPVM